MTETSNTNPMTLDEALTPLSDSPADVSYTVPINWMQGRSCFGGLSTAMGLSALRLKAGPEQSLRSLQVTFAGPLSSGFADVETQVLRQGKSTQMIMASVRSRSDESRSVATQVTAIFGADREALSYPLPVQDDLPAQDSVPPVPDVPGLLPDFLRNMDMRWTGNAVPYSGNKDWDLSIWVRLKERGTINTEQMAVALADTHPSAILSHFKGPVMSSSVTWSLEVVRPFEQTKIGHDGWLHNAATLESAANGYCQQSTRFYDSAGQLVMLGRQTMVYFG